MNRRDTAHSCVDAQGRRWPVLEGIAFARVSRAALAAEALALLDAGEQERALVLLLADQDDWWNGPAAEPEALRELVQKADGLSLRQAMALLAWGPVADYFAHRWSDATFMAGLALTEAHWNAPRSAFELACGIGHHLRALAQHGVEVSGADIVFAKLWVARRWVVPEAELTCLDAASQPWPVREDARFDLVTCHDAFYFLEPKGAIVTRLRDMLRPGGVLAVSHIHNREWPNLSAGAAVTAAELSTLFPDTHVYDDAELSRAALDRRTPRAALPETLRGAEAFSVALASGQAMPVKGRLVLPPAGAPLRRNPLYRNGQIAWPSERYAGEYGPRAPYPPHTECPETARLDPGTEGWALRRELLDLPERW
ncbi:class I SAM-dependent methyltransferase [Pseudoroseomonas globiformis]|uniref:Class I SAM-dependent methyltransferase n=1 Tax=Teichococcus globiformis TaxID=2307229 RepID=A0ABV7FVK6_9PROT